jgi:hypothetical protein
MEQNLTAIKPPFALGNQPFVPRPFTSVPRFLSCAQPETIMLKYLFRLSVLCLGVALVIPNASADSLVAFWSEITLRAIRNSTLGPPIQARALALVHTAAYDAWAAYDDVAVGTRYGGALRRPAIERTLVNKEKAVSFAAYRVLLDIFPAQSNAFNGTMLLLGYDPNDSSADPNTPQGIGNLVAGNLLEFRHNDGSNQLGNTPGTNGVVVTAAYGDYSGYQPVNTTNVINDPNRWQPILFSNGVAPRWLLPHWSNVVTFALTNPAQFRPPPPARFDEGSRALSAKYRAEARQIVALTAHLTDKQKALVEYWADGPRSETPPGHWNLFAQFVSERDGHNIDDDAKMFFALNNAMLDASVAVWEAKIFYDSPRPITVIHFLYAGQEIPTWRGTNGAKRTVLGENWLPYQPSTFITPPFGEYVSGHSTFSAAGAEILKSFTGSDEFRGSVHILPRTSKVEVGVSPQEEVVLSWPTFSAAANQAGLSRRLGGIHFLQGDLEARKLGREIGALVWEKAQTYFNGTATAPGPI